MLSSGGYGPVTITKSVSIIAPEGIYAGISVFSGSGITIATAGVNVVLRGLTINGLGGTYGVNMTDGASLSIERCLIAKFGHGLRAVTAADVRVLNSLFVKNTEGIVLSGGATGTISQTQFLGNVDLAVWVTDSFAGSAITTTAYVDRSLVKGGGSGFAAQNLHDGNTSRLFVTDAVVVGGSAVGVSSYTTAGTAYVSVRNSQLAGLAYGAMVNGASATLVASGNSIVNNGYGFYQLSSGVLESAGDNEVRSNTSNVYGAITTTFPKM